MNIFRFITDPPIIIILSTFVANITYMTRSYMRTYHQLTDLSNNIEPFENSNISYKFEEFKHIMTENPCSVRAWDDFKNTLVFSDTIAYQDEKTEELDYDSVSDSMADIQTTSDVMAFFNEESLAKSHYNKHIIAVAPTLLTGFGPLFTFIKIGIAFGLLDFSSTETLTHSIAAFVGSMQIAAMCSVCAVASALIFMTTEKLVFSNFVLPAVNKVQNKLSDLFKIISSEKFLVDLLKTTKTQSHENAVLLKSLPADFAGTIKKDLSNVVIPYLDSMIFGINNLNKTVEKKSSAGDDGLGGLFS